MNNKLKQFLFGIRLSAYLIVPFWIMVGLIEYLFPQVLDNNYKIIISEVLLAIVYFASPVYWVLKKNWPAVIGALLGGIAIMVLCFFVGAAISCSQGVCF